MKTIFAEQKAAVRQTMLRLDKDSNKRVPGKTDAKIITMEIISKYSEYLIPCLTEPLLDEIFNYSVDGCKNSQKGKDYCEYRSLKCQ